MNSWSTRRGTSSQVPYIFYVSVPKTSMLNLVQDVPGYTDLAIRNTELDKIGTHLVDA